LSNHYLIDELLTPREYLDYEISNLWEDFGFSRNDNRFKNLKFSPCGVISKMSCHQYNNNFERRLGDIM
jgi:hypothetical protein